MKRIAILILILILNTLYAEEPFWEYLEGPEGGIIKFIEITKNGDIILGSHNGVFKSINQGDSWEWILKGGIIIDCAISNSGMIFINRIVDSTGGPQGKREFLYSSDNGESWEKVKNCDLDYPKYLDFDDNDTLYAFIADYEKIEMHYSGDYGKTWNKITYQFSMEGRLGIYRFYVHKNREIIVYGQYDDLKKLWGAAFISKDMGMTWKQLELIESGAYKFHISNNYNFFIGNGKGLFCSADSGKTWNNVLKANTVNEIRSISDTEIYISSYEGIFYSSDDGYTWEKISDGKILEFNIDTQDNFYSKMTNGFYKSTDRGKTWQSKNNGFYSNMIYDIGCDQRGNIYALVSPGIYKSSDKGRTWSFYRPPVTSCKNIEISKQNNVYVSYYDWDDERGGVYISTDQGTTWDTIPIPYTFFSVNDIKVDENENIYLATNRKRLLKTTDMGETWEQYDNGVCYDYNCVEINSEGHIFIGTDLFDLYRSTDEGETWERQIHQDQGFGLTEIVFHPTNGIGYAGGGLGLYRTSDNGRSWRKIGDGNNCLTLDSSGNFYTTFSRISKDGTSFESITSGYLPFHYSILIEYSPTGYLFAATEYGGLYRSREPVVSVKETTEHTNGIILKQNTPNPFEENTEISYYLDKPAFVRIKLYNLLGIEVAGYANEFMPGGWHTLIVNGSKLADGVYILVLEADEKRESKIIHKVR